MHDSIYYKHYKSATSNGWNAYLEQIKRETPMVAPILNILAFVRFAEVPSELLIKRFLGMEAKYIFVATIESFKYS